ncbi:DUF262 domain-containing protein [Rheinheimera sp. UJ63]|uniref:DUF262 domain-containing protein n=1 Tax=Rheinheimera sp. UJ63 TaxID=2910157 RepID=UPI001F3CF817|nr:DUF262 domain-containing protein [Rheinheimera sp. UJ63]MCF4010594.1 DUF262 domain-containing HNH endonuclease family protein [Rheinheimera sp. UJ63]
MLNEQTVQTELLTLKQVSERMLGFIIPSYQRPYVWKEEDVVKLFGDIENAFEAKEQHYFIGSALSAVHPTTDNLVYELIDGQQRITTMMLISVAFKSAKIATPLANVAILGNQPRLSFAIRESVRNLLGSYAGLEHLSKPGIDVINKDPYLKHLYSNLEVLKQRVETLASKQSFDIKSFADYIYSKVSWVNNIVPDVLDLNRLFASMNTAGIQLEPVDLLKAKLFKLINTEKALYNKIWQACEHTNNYFERNLKQLFPDADWNALKFEDLSQFSREIFRSENNSTFNNQTSTTLAELFAQVQAGDKPTNAEDVKAKDGTDEIEDETVYCRSIVGFELLLIHSLRIFCAQQGWSDLSPRIKAANLMACFDGLLSQSEETIKAFLLLLWQVRFQFDKWVVKWVEHDDNEDPMLRLTTISRSNSSGNYYINRTATELNELVQLQAVLNFTGDRSAHYWLTALLAKLVSNPNLKYSSVLAVLEQLDNPLSLTTNTQKEASFSLAKGLTPALTDWQTYLTYFTEPKGTSFEHYWFQKLEYLLWKHGDKTDSNLRSYRITSKNSLEHVHPQHEEYKNTLPKELLDAFGNLVLLSPGENSSYSNQTVLKKKADFASKPRYDSLKLKALFDTYAKMANQWDEVGIKQHQADMLGLLEQHYQ